MRSDIKYNNIIDSEEARIAQAAADAAPALPSDQIDPRKFYIKQRYEKYTPEDHAVWSDLYDRRWGVLAQQVSRTFIDGLEAIRLVRDRIPLLFDTVLDQDTTIAGGAVLKKGTALKGINGYLKQLTGWSSYGVPGYLPQKSFFACLAARQFPTTVLIRPRDVMDYLPEPDIFHDVFGHVPLHADPVFADFLQTYGKAALLCEDPQHIERLGRLFWFTVEFGLIRTRDGLRIYGNGILSSRAEALHSLTDAVAKLPFDADRIAEQEYDVWRLQPLLYVIDSFEQLADEFDRWAKRRGLQT